MNRQNDMRDTYIKNIRIDNPNGLLGVPPDADNALIIVTDRAVVRKVINEIIWPDGKKELRQ